MSALLENPYGYYVDFRSGHHNSTVDGGLVIDDFLHQNILAALAGDGCLIKNTKRGTHRLAWNMGNKEHALCKAARFKKLNAAYRERDNPGFGDKWFQVRTSCTKILDRYAEKYGDSANGYNIGKICRELNEVGWAVYFGDDGHSSISYGKYRQVFIHTEAFMEDECWEVANALNDFLGLNGARVNSYIGGTKKREMFYVNIFDEEAQDEFFKRITDHMEDGVEYKIKSNRVNK